MSLCSFLPLMIILSGGYLLIKLRAFFFIHPIKTLRRAFQGAEILDSIASLLLALSGTLGVGNIVGIAVGISLGGAGSVFWMLVSAVFSSVLKYAEVLISSDTGGGIGIITAVKESFGRWAACLYSALALALALTMGTALQSGAIRACAVGIGGFEISDLILPLMIAVIPICVFGKGWIKGAVAVIIPIATLLYTVLCLCVIIPNADRLGDVISNIIYSAFDISAISGGVGAFLIASGMREGFARGLLSNEAGAGTSSFSHTSGEAHDPFRGGFFGILEVLFDTVILCSLTAFTILLGFPAEQKSFDVTALSQLFAQYTGGVGGYILFLALIAFAVSTTLCWYYYGNTCMHYLFGRRWKWIYFTAFFASFAAGLIWELPSLVFITDAILFFLTVISVGTVLKNSDRVKTLSENLFK